MSSLITRLRARGACPLLAIGPILVGGKQQASWVSELGSLQNAAYKIGLGRYILSDDVAQVERAQFLDSFEHPSSKGRAEWTRRIINRLKDREMNPCAAVMAGE
jgi:predicted membrane metal-binding protein